MLPNSMTTTENCPITGAQIVYEESEDYGIEVRINRTRTCRPDLISNRMSQYYQGKLDWQNDGHRNDDERNWDGVWGGSKHFDGTFANWQDGLNFAESEDGSSETYVQIRSKSKELLESIRDEVASMVPKYCKVDGSAWPEGEMGYSYTIHYQDRPTWKQGQYNETGVKRASKIVPALRDVLIRRGF